MIDVHCHLLPGLDDGAVDLDAALAMARMAVTDGITSSACTPHIYPGLYENNAAGIEKATTALRMSLAQAEIPLSITFGADIQLVPELLQGLTRGAFPTINGSRYFLLEPPHHTVPVRFQESLFDALAAGYVPIITHPERLTWLDEQYYDWFVMAAAAGAWIQVTAGAVVGRFGRQAEFWAERLLDDGVVHLLATDAHDPSRRPPLLAEGRDAAVKRVGETEACRLVDDRPRAIIENRAPGDVTAPPGLAGSIGKPRADTILGRLARGFGGRRRK